MQIRPLNTNMTTFKGYDACPLKKVYMQGLHDKREHSIYDEMSKVGKSENFGVFYFNGIDKISNDNNPHAAALAYKWAQDDKTFIYKDGEKQLITGEKNGPSNYVFSKLLNVKNNTSDSFITGGNVFLGKKPNGENWAIIGKNEENKYSLDEFCKIYGVKKENVHIISQPNYHIDMAIRPIGYPYVLVNDEKLVREKVKDNELLKAEVDRYYNFLNSKHQFSDEPYATCDTTVKELKKAGFIPIRVAGVFRKDVNYMNALVNKHEDNSLSYITNSTRFSDCEVFDKIFEEELTSKVPNLSKIYFVSGQIVNDIDFSNSIMQRLKELHGGIHCTTLEEPDFEVWG